MAKITYIGVSGFMCRREVEEVLATAECWPSDRRLAVGVLVSDKTIAGRKNKYSLRYPERDEISSIFLDDPRCLNIIHYSSEVRPTPETARRLLDYGGAYCDGLQFNGSWPTPADAARIWQYMTTAAPQLDDRAQGVPRRMILQINADLLAQLGAYDGMGAMVDYVRYWHEWATDVLIDQSGGHGVPLDDERLRVVRNAKRALNARYPGLGVGFAGSLDAAAVRKESVAALIAEGASVDAESRLRDECEGGGNLVTGVAVDYVHAALAAAQAQVSEQEEGGEATHAAWCKRKVEAERTLAAHGCTLDVWPAGWTDEQKGAARELAAGGKRPPASGS